MTQDSAEALALNCLQFLASEPERLGRFLALSGAGPDDVKNSLTNSAFLGGVLDYVLADETLLYLIAESTSQPINSFSNARKFLPGSQD